MKVLVPILIVIVVVGGIFYFKSSKQNPEVKTSSSVPAPKGAEISNDFEGTFVFDAEQSNATWTGSKKIVKNYFDSGTIDIKSGNVSFEKGEIENGEIVFDMTSIQATSTGKGDRQDDLTKHLKSEDFFEVETYPEAKYTVKSSTKTADGYKLEGDLSLKAKTNPVTVNIKTATENGNAVIAGIAEINRAQFDVKFGSESFFDDLGDNVINDIFTIEFNIVARP